MFFAVLLERSKSRLGFFSCIGIYRSCRVNADGIYHLLLKQVLKTAKPGSARTLTRLLTKPLVEVTVMAGKQHTQTHPKFTWLFLGIPKGQICTPVVIRIAADTEEEAREWYSRWDLTFAAKIRSECSLYQYASGAYELNVMGGFHG
ncbi:host cell division inhibitor Icd-like protein [Citrobacter freundii]|uniref:host cell division inhibitor Icd-like protein n=2 Tax=Enterobacteriaceae TaxID=543 RepID=UPI0028BD3B95|nr:host cell division inhibitor Icd-like protein [Citrobacter europaeus]MDT7087625.1 host cell division inhibitor Icd-like protein [Citrobacter europaeus]